MLNIIGGLIPGIIWLIIIYLLTKKSWKNKWLYILIIIITGAISSYICYRLEMHFGTYFKKVKDSNYFEILLYAIFGVAIFEEGIKWLITTVISFIDKNKKSIITYSLLTAFAFATSENILFYSIKYGFTNTLNRTFTAFPSHLCNGIWMGYFLNKAISEKKYKLLYYLLSIIIPITIHALYNSFLYGGKYQQYFYFYYIPQVIITIYLIYKKTKKYHT